MWALKILPTPWAELRTQDKAIRGQHSSVDDRHYNGIGVLHVAAQYPIESYRPSILIYKASMPLTTHTGPRGTKYCLQIGSCGPPTPPPPNPCWEGQLKHVGNENFTYGLSGASNFGQSNSRPAFIRCTTTSPLLLTSFEWNIKSAAWTYLSW